MYLLFCHFCVEDNKFVLILFSRYDEYIEVFTLMFLCASYANRLFRKILNVYLDLGRSPGKTYI